MKKLLFLGTLICIVFLGLFAPKSISAACSSSCGWTGSSPGASCVAYQDTDRCNWAGTNNCACQVVQGCLADDPWPSSCNQEGPSITNYFQDSACCGGGGGATSCNNNGTCEGGNGEDSSNCADCQSGGGGGGGGSSCSGSCYTLGSTYNGVTLENCGSWGMPSGSGSCSGGNEICCGSPGGSPSASCSIPSPSTIRSPYGSWQYHELYIPANNGAPPEVRFATNRYGGNVLTNAFFTSWCCDGVGQDPRPFFARIRGDAVGGPTLLYAWVPDDDDDPYDEDNMRCERTINVYIEPGTMTLAPNPVRVDPGGTEILTATVNLLDGSSVNNVTYIIDDPLWAGASSPSTETSSPYTSIISGYVPDKTTRVRATAITSTGNIRKNATVSVNPIDCQPANPRPVGLTCAPTSTDTIPLNIEWDRPNWSDTYRAQLWSGVNINTLISDRNWRTADWFGCALTATCDLATNSREWNVRPGAYYVRIGAGGDCTNFYGGRPAGPNATGIFTVDTCGCDVEMVGADTFYANGPDETQTINIISSPEAITSVNFYTQNAAIVNRVGTVTDSAEPFERAYRPIAEGTTNLFANLRNATGTVCTVTKPVEVLAVGPWWQVEDGSVGTGGNIFSPIPDTCISDITCASDFIEGEPGTVVHSGATADFAADASTGTVSATDWLAQTSFTGRTFDYDLLYELASGRTFVDTDLAATYPSRIVPSSVFESGGVADQGYYWYRAVGDITISGDAVLTGGRKVVLFVEEGDVTIDGNMTFNDPEEDFFLTIVGEDAAGAKGNINLTPAVANLQGICFSEGQFATGSDTSAGPDQQLNVIGSIVALDGLDLQRDLQLGNETLPGEIFTYDPNIVLNYPSSLSPKRLIWREV